jgi:hypothetical protein
MQACACRTRYAFVLLRLVRGRRLKHKRQRDIHSSAGALVRQRFHYESVASANAISFDVGRGLDKSAHKMIDFVEANCACHDQVNCDDIVQQSRGDEDQDASQKRDERRDMGYGERHIKIPLVAGYKASLTYHGLRWDTIERPDNRLAPRDRMQIVR